MFPKTQKPLPNKSWKQELKFAPTDKVTVKPIVEGKKKAGSDTNVTTKKKKLKKRGNTVRNITKKVAEQVRARDIHCIFCPGEIQEIHHAFYGAESNYGKNRNEADQLVGLCSVHHDQLHSR